MADFNNLGFAFSGIKTQQFAIIEEAYKKTGTFELAVNVGFSLDESNRTIIISVEFSFYKKETPFIILALDCFFEINKTGWSKLSHPDELSYIIPKTLSQHLTVLSVGTARGVLHAKTEGTIFNDYVLPTVDITKIVNKDVTVSQQDMAEF